MGGRRHKYRLREQEEGKDDFDIPEGLRDMTDPDIADEDEEMEMVMQVEEEPEDTGFEVVQQDEDVQPSYSTTISSKYDSSDDEEPPAPISGQKRAAAARRSSNRPRRKKNK